MNNDLTGALQIVNETLEQKRNYREDARRAHAVAIAAERGAKGRVAEFDRLIEQLEATRENLEKLLGLSPKIPTIVPTLQETKDNVEYTRTLLTSVYGDTDDYEINAVIATINGNRRNHNRILVLECNCPAFRFTKGELRDGKTCKHIKQYFNRNTRYSCYYAAKKALTINGLCKVGESFRFPNVYRGSMD